MKNYYETLGVDKSASVSDIKKAYHKKAKACHPDKRDGNTTEAEATKQFQAVGEAYETLKDPNKRAAHDRALKSAENAPQPPRASQARSSQHTPPQHAPPQAKQARNTETAIIARNPNTPTAQSSPKPAPSSNPKRGAPSAREDAAASTPQQAPAKQGRRRGYPRDPLVRLGAAVGLALAAGARAAYERLKSQQAIQDKSSKLTPAIENNPGESPVPKPTSAIKDKFSKTPVPKPTSALKDMPKQVLSDRALKGASELAQQGAKGATKLASAVAKLAG